MAALSSTTIGGNLYAAKNTPTTGNISDTLRPSTSELNNWEYLGFKLHLSAAATGSTFVLRLNSGISTGSTYNVKIYSNAMNTVQDIIWRPDPPVLCRNNDIINSTYVNDSSGLVGIEHFWRYGA